jgi:hypothetical protein
VVSSLKPTFSVKSASSAGNLQLYYKYYKARLSFAMNFSINAAAPFNLVLSVGTQVVSRVDLKTTAGEPTCLKGAVGVITQSPTDGSHAYQSLLSWRLRRIPMCWSVCTRRWWS